MVLPGAPAAALGHQHYAGGLRAGQGGGASGKAADDLARRGALEEVKDWRKRLHHEFNAASGATNLPERPDCEKANAFLIEARRSALLENLP